jgi:hypothetical protein
LTQNFLYFQRNQYFHYFLMNPSNPMTLCFQMNQNFQLNQEVPLHHHGLTSLNFQKNQSFR